VLATHVAASGVAADYASSSMDNGGDELAIASAKSRVDDAISVCASIAHQGSWRNWFSLMSMDYIFLQEDFGLGELSMGLEVIGLKYLEKKAVSNGANNFWPSITSGKI
jgi:hypothetical protein